ncbi:energy transducer TonB [Marichromatium gracile]|uniref:Protein TonB n=1 Tax=Marichromatium gracile TaxID=1048 RepID=A0ABR5VIH2_MARGR|nr:energy transducer TonB [Marichromatium gracile]KXX64008.1 hypothetical protein AY586_15105 [Marichromatium gracile]
MNAPAPRLPEMPWWLAGALALVLQGALLALLAGRVATAEGGERAADTPLRLRLAAAPAPTADARPEPPQAAAPQPQSEPEPEPQPEPEPNTAPAPRAEPQPQPDIQPTPRPTPTPTPEPKPQPTPKPPPRPTSPPKPEPTPSARSAPAEAPAPSRPRHAAPPASRDAAPARETRDGRAAGGRATQTTPDQPVAYLHTPRPAYPARARRLGQHGEVTLEVLVGRDGRAAEIRLARSSGVESLDRAARETVAHWRFRPARVGGAAQASWVRIPVRFTLNH